MRAIFWTVIVLAAAVGLALVLREHSGNVLILVDPWRIELSITLAFFVLLACFVLLYLLLRLIAWLGGSPERFSLWRVNRRQRRDHSLLENSWIHLLEGRYEQAEKELTALQGKTRATTTKVIAGLAAARTAYQLGDRRACDGILTSVRTHAGNNPRLKQAVSMVMADLYLEERRPQEALDLLKPLHHMIERHVHARRLYLRAYQQLGDHEKVYENTRWLLRKRAMTESEAAQYLTVSGAARLQAAGPDGFKAVWGDLRANERTIPAIAYVAAEIHNRAGNYDEAAKILESAIQSDMDPQLLSAYAICPQEQVKRRLGKAESWLNIHPENPALLAALGVLCMTGKLWGQAERHLLHSMRLRSDMRIHALLGSLYDATDKPEKAAQHWRLTSQVVARLSVDSVVRLLPAVDTRRDPTLIELEAGLMVAEPEAESSSTSETSS